MQLLITNQDFGPYQRGDIISVERDSHIWGAKESLTKWVLMGNSPNDFPSPQFSVLFFEGVRPDLNLAEPELEEHPEIGGKQIVVMRRAWYFNLDAMPANLKAEILIGGSITNLAKVHVKKITRKIDGLTIAATRARETTPYRRAYTNAIVSPSGTRTTF